MTKPTVRYRGAASWCGERAFLQPVDHPDVSRVVNLGLATTSRVLDWDADTGRIETLNTIYMPEEVVA